MNTAETAGKEEFWSRFADNFEEQTDYITGREAVNAISERLGELNMLGKTLELACGNGTYTRDIAKNASEVIASDLSDEMLSVAEKKLGHFVNISFEKADCFALQYPNNSFDTVFMANLIHVVTDPECVIKESKRVAKAGGRIIIVSFTAEGMSFFNKLGMVYRYLSTWGQPPKGAQSFTVAKLSDLLSTQGLIINEAELLGSSTKAVFVSAEKP